jgi:hypothetical protein
MRCKVVLAASRTTLHLHKDWIVIMSDASDDQIFDVFISYSRRDSEYVQAIVDHLSGFDLRIWFDRQSILFGTRIRESILHGIKSSSIILVFISQNSISSSWVLNELDSAMMREMNEGKALVIPVILGKISDVDIPGDLRGKYYLDLRYNFKKRWIEQKENFVENIIALAHGEVFGPDAIVLAVGDPLVRYLSSYKFHHKRQSARLDNRLMAKVGRAFGMQIAEEVYEGEFRAPTFVYQPETSSDAQDERVEDDPAQVEQFLKYSATGRSFVQRYGEFALQQLALFFIDRLGFDLTGGFGEEEINQLFDRVHAVLTYFGLQFKFESVGADLSHQILLRITPDDISVTMVGADKITKVDEDID